MLVNLKFVYRYRNVNISYLLSSVDYNLSGYNYYDKLLKIFI